MDAVAEIGRNPVSKHGFSPLGVETRSDRHMDYNACVCVCVFFFFFPFILDIKFVGRTSRGHTGGRSHRIFHPPSFCGACLNFYREKDSAIPFSRRMEKYRKIQL